MLAPVKRGTPLFTVLLSLPATAIGFALSVQISALSWLLSTQYGLEIHEIGLVWAAGPLAGIIGQVGVGLISDKTWLWGGRRRPYIFISAFASALMFLALPNIGVIADKLELESIIGVAIIVALTLDIAINVGFNPARTLVADVTKEGEERTKSYAWVQSISGCFGVLAYLIGATLGNFILIYVAIGLVLAFCILPMLLIEEPRELHKDPETPAEKASLKEILLAIKPMWAFAIYAAIAMPLQVMHIERDSFLLEIICMVATATLLLETVVKDRKQTQGLRQFHRVCSANAMTWIAAQTMFVYFIAFVQERFPELDADQTGQMMSYSFLVLSIMAGALPGLVLAPLAKHIGNTNTIGLTAIIMAIGYLGIYFYAHSAWTLYGMMFLVGTGWSALISLTFAVMTEQIKGEKMGLYMGLFNLSIVLPQLFVSLAVGLWINQLENKSVLLILCAFACIGAALLWLRVNEKHSTKESNLSAEA